MRPARSFVSLVAIACAGGCITPNYETCADGTACPPGLVCAPVAGCASPPAIAACDGLTELGACTIANGPGECRGGVCVPASCGNGLVDTTLGEVCDDGNNLDDDGCSADCKSDETCGNGVLDFVKGEQCDDGNLTELDGCSRDCKPEPLTSLQLATAATMAPAARAYPSMVYDPDRHVMVLFGGVAELIQNDTWEYDGATWKPIATIGAPQKRFAQGMTYDSKRHRMIMFGGDGGAYLSDTWAFDGVAWTQLSNAGPGARYISLAYDAARDRVVLYGADYISGSATATWEFDGTTWTAKQTATSPPARFATSLGYDPVRGKVVMFGGVVSGANASDTWEYDGVDWHQATPTTIPPARQSAGMTYDPIRHQLVIGPGTGDVTVWGFDGTTWAQIGTPTLLSSRGGDPLAYDISRQRGVVFGGVDPVGNLLGDTWELGTDWVKPAPVSPSARDGVALGYDPLRGRVVLFGGHHISDDANDDLADTWELVGGTWQPLSPTTSPPARWGARFAYDPVRRRLVLFGGSTGDSTFPNGNPVSGGSRTLFNDTWEWDGSTWTEQTPATSPPARMTPAMAWDSVGQRIVMHGGWTGTATTGNPVDDTWSWDGTTWTQITSATMPAARYGHGMVEDVAGQRLVMFGGWTDNGGGSPLDDTWQLVGSTWTQLATPSAPFARGDITLVYDSVGQRVVMVEGTFILGQGYNAYTDMWQLVGATWTQLFPDQLPPARAISAAVFDSAQARTIVFGGVRIGGYIGDTWSVGYDPVVAAEVCTGGADHDGDGLVACADPDCAYVCSPLCATNPASCTDASAGCGDGVCSELETCRCCPTDCGACPAVCGDAYCDPGESAATCPGDCP